MFEQGFVFQHSVLDSNSERSTNPNPLLQVEGFSMTGACALSGGWIRAGLVVREIFPLSLRHYICYPYTVPLELTVTKRTDRRLLELMKRHYSQPKGFVGRNICYAIEYDGVYYGHIVSGSATRFLPGRNEALGIDLTGLDHVINNIFFHIEPGVCYPRRNFVPYVIAGWREAAKEDWRRKYADRVVGFESLVELPRTGECYRRDGWELVGQTKGYTCKREGGKGTDDYSGKRVWDTVNLRPKLVFVKRV